MQEESERLKEFTPSGFFLPFLIAFSMVEKILASAHSCHLEECIHTKYGSPGVSSS